MTGIFDYPIFTDGYCYVEYFEIGDVIRVVHTGNKTCCDCGYVNPETATIELKLLGHSMMHGVMCDFFDVKSDYICPNCGHPMIHFGIPCQMKAHAYAEEEVPIELCPAISEYSIREPEVPQERQRYNPLGKLFRSITSMVHRESDE